MAEKDFFINSIPLIDVQGYKSIPTALFYQKSGKPLIGIEAKSASESGGRDTLNEDFKIDLGNSDPSSSVRKREFPTANGPEKTAAGLTADFLYYLLVYIREWMPQENIGETPGIVVAEPIAMTDDKLDSSWLSNYRSNIKRILNGQGYKMEQIDFLPEPFAVFQYYKYGLRHGLLSGQTKHIALVLDFGGGSFDVCIIETDKEGEITTKRKNTRPIAASSAPIGGFFVNKCLAEALYLKYAKEDKEKKTELRKGIELYNQWRTKNQNLSLAKSSLRNFAKKFHGTIYDLEDSKLALCNLINNWDLEVPVLEKVPIRLPKDPFSEETEYFNAELTASEFREIFTKKVWKDQLEPLINSALKRGKEQLLGEPITIVLLSGGSCNIRWLGKLLDQHFSYILRNAQIVELDDDFQEVVAKGVAVECARRFYDDENHSGDFTSVTYNGLHLVLEADQKGLQLKKYQPIDNNPNLETKKEGVLLPAASKLRNQFDVPLTWKVRLDNPPRRTLDYFFLRSGLTPYKQLEEVADDSSIQPYSDELLNILSNSVNSPPNCHFDSSIQVELKIEKETKTARVKFIYSKGANGSKSISVEGKPFYLDMTDTQDNPSSKAYIGLDFGTSNTSVSYISQSAIKTYKKRSTERHWLSLNDLPKFLPYPLASPLSKYLSESFSQSNRVKYAREFIEGGLALAAYISYLELCSSQRKKPTKIFKGFTQRSLGPLWKLLKDSLGELGRIGRNSKFSAAYNELISEEFFSQVDEGITFLGQNKHEKAEDKDFNPRIINILANVSQKMFADHKFGYFENVQQERFKNGSYKGSFRLATGYYGDFTETIDYSGSFNFVNQLAYLVNFEDRLALPLDPLIFWYPCNIHTDQEHCYLYDIPIGRTQPFEGFSYKAAGLACSLVVSSKNDELNTIKESLTNFVTEDPDLLTIKF